MHITKSATPSHTTQLPLYFFTYSLWPTSDSIVDLWTMHLWSGNIPSSHNVQLFDHSWCPTTTIVLTLFGLQYPSYDLQVTLTTIKTKISTHDESSTLQLAKIINHYVTLSRPWQQQQPQPIYRGLCVCCGPYVIPKLLFTVSDFVSDNISSCPVPHPCPN